MANKEFVEVNALKEYVNTVFGDPILTIAVNNVLKNLPKTNIAYCGECKFSDEIECSKGKVWCNKTCRYMDKDAFCSGGK